MKFSNQLKESAKCFFITTSILFACFVILNLKGIDGDFDNFFDAIGSLGSLAIGLAGYKIAKEQKISNDLKLGDLERKILRDYYEKLSLLSAKSYNYWFGGNFNKDPQNKEDPTTQLFALFSSSKAELPNELSLLIEEIWLFYSSIVAPNLLDGATKNIALGKKLSEMYESESKLRLKIESLFARYLKIPTL